MTTKGIDVSQFQGNINFKKVKACGINFVIIRAGFGRNANQIDPCFEKNYRGAKAAGLAVGAYWYSYADSVADAETEAKACLEVIKDKKFDMPIYFDLEERSQFAKGKTFCSDCVTAFCGTLEKSNYYAGLYISCSPLMEYITTDVAERYALWVAEYGAKCEYTGTHGMWQYSSSGKISGISGNVDTDICYVDYPTLIKSKGLNGYEKGEEGNILDTIGYKKGDKTIGVYALKKLLMLAYYEKLCTKRLANDSVFGIGTVADVNSLLKRWGYAQTGVAGKKFIGKLYSEILKKIK